MGVHGLRALVVTVGVALPQTDAHQPPIRFKAVAHKLARATYHVMRDGVAFEPERAFA